jgi:flagellar hook-associated protein 1 FlgK
MIAFLDTNVKKRARQQRVIRAAAPLLARAGWDGRGVEAALLAEARDPLLDAQIRAEASVASSLAAQQTNLQNAGICLDELIRFSAAPNGLNGLDADLSKLFSSFETLSGDPANVPLRRRIVRSAEDIAAKFNRASSRLDGLKNDLNASIQEDVVRANQDLSDIAGLNRRIMESQAWGGRAGTLAGQRGQHLKSLAGRVNIIATRRADGGVNVSIGGVAMVCGAKTPDSLATYPDQNDNLRIQAQNAGTRLKPAGGSIAGKITARDGGLAGLQSGLNALASQLITRVNSIYSSGCESNSGAGRDFFTGTGASDTVAGRGRGAGPGDLRPKLCPNRYQPGRRPVEGQRRFEQQPGSDANAGERTRLGARRVARRGMDRFAAVSASLRGLRPSACNAH